MATPLDKAVVRLTELQDDGRRILVTLHPDDRISFKPQGLKEPSRVGLPLMKVYEMARTGRAVISPDYKPKPVDIPEATDDETAAYVRALHYTQWIISRNPKLAKSIAAGTNDGPDQWEIVKLLQEEKERQLGVSE